MRKINILKGLWLFNGLVFLTSMGFIFLRNIEWRYYLGAYVMLILCVIFAMLISAANMLIMTGGFNDK